MKTAKSAPEFFGGMLMKYFENLEDTYELNQFVEYLQGQVIRYFDSIGVECEVAATETIHRIIKFSAFDVDVYVKFDKILNSHDHMTYDNDVSIVLPKEKIVVYFE